MPKKNDWLRLLGYVTGLVNQELLLRNEYLVAENRILKARSSLVHCAVSTRSAMSGASLAAMMIRNQSPANDGFQIPSDSPSPEAPQPPYCRIRRDRLRVWSEQSDDLIVVAHDCHGCRGDTGFPAPPASIKAWPSIYRSHGPASVMCLPIRTRMMTPGPSARP
jgi:hypothetical protein